jgi:predicted small lipoprotein YifL
MTRLLQTGTVICVALVASAGLSGCGRRGPLEAPPGVAAPTVSAGTPNASEPGQANPAAGNAKPYSRRTRKIVPPKRDTPFDWLL